MKVVIKLDEKDVECLIGGGCLTLKVPDSPEQIKIFMADIGFDLISKMMWDIQTDRVAPYRDLTRENQGKWVEL